MSRTPRIDTKLNRRKFVAASSSVLITAAASTAFAAPAIRTSKTKATNETVIGEGDYQYKADHDFCQLPSKFKWQTTHNVAVDSNDNLYVIHEGHRHLKDHPSIFVFDAAGKFIRAFGSQFQGGGHGIEVRNEGGEEFLYVAAYQGIKSFAKMTLKGDILWYQRAPMESGVYKDGEALATEAGWDRKSFLPTNFAFLENGGFLLADGYGTYFIHEFDKDGKWVRCFGGPGKEPGQFHLSHGLWVDRRDGKTPSLYVTDRSRNKVQILDMDGKHMETLSGFGKPANFDTQGDLMLVPELLGMVTILDKENNPVAKLGDGRARLDEVEKLREKPDQWTDGQFVHPHDACFGNDGSIFVAEWVKTGRVTKLTKV
ncbi:NHL repeat-containing protein [Mariniblastus fucicola]|uniref:NHL repeat protein n=1 Tax=Mariniblastus fucicola TaxID=980251 RepID=A0A5B9PEZ5_9BACT|nr:hypothetical protein [Mariniblastus fucicola]QEG21473.1 NHL repeat protein [Mariniblastus fucicola]